MGLLYITLGLIEGSRASVHTGFQYLKSGTRSAACKKQTQPNQLR